MNNNPTTPQLPPLDEATLARLEELEREASPGRYFDNRTWITMELKPNEEFPKLYTAGDNCYIYSEGNGVLCLIANHLDIDDAEFISVLRNASPSLLAELRRLRSENAALAEQVAGYHANSDGYAGAALELADLKQAIRDKNDEDYNNAIEMRMREG